MPRSFLITNHRYKDQRPESSTIPSLDDTAAAPTSGHSYSYKGEITNQIFESV